MDISCIVLLFIIRERCSMWKKNIRSGMTRKSGEYRFLTRHSQPVRPAVTARRNIPAVLDSRSPRSSTMLSRMSILSDSTSLRLLSMVLTRDRKSTINRTKRETVSKPLRVKRTGMTVIPVQSTVSATSLETGNGLFPLSI